MNKNILHKWYIIRKLSSAEIARKFNCSVHKIDYWLGVHKIQKRTISEALYQKNNPKGDPFSFSTPKNLKNMFLFGLGLGLYWGEGTKRGLNALRLSNSDPNLVKMYIDFLVDIYNIKKNKLRFQLQIYNDLDNNGLMSFWSKHLLVNKSQFYKSTILVRRGQGMYREKMKYGVLIVIFNNIKLKNLICTHIANMTSV